MSAETDTQLLARAIKQQDQAAFAALFDRYKHEAYCLALHLTHNAALAEDAVQDAMLGVWQLKKVPPSGTRKWILGIVAHKSLQVMRTRKRASRREERKSGMTFDQTQTAPDTKHEREELLQTLRSHMGKLPAAEQEMLALYFGAELPETEIAKMMALSQTSVSRKLHDALGRLRTNLAAAGFAAAVPFVALEGLNQALLSGHRAPVSLTNNVLNALNAKSADVPSRRLSRRVVRTKKSGSMALLGGGAVVLAVSLAAWAAMSKPAAVVPQLAPVAPQPAPVIEKKSTGFSRHWSFETGPATDLPTSQVTWQWKKQGDSGVMEAPVDKAVILPLPISKSELGNGPIRVSVMRNGKGRRGAACINTQWFKGDAFLPYREHLKPAAIPDGSSPTNSYIIGRYIYTLQGETLSEMYLFDDALVAQADGLCLVIQNMTVESIDIRRVEPSDIPALLRDPEAAIRQMGVPEIPGKNAGLAFRIAN